MLRAQLVLPTRALKTHISHSAAPTARCSKRAHHLLKFICPPLLQKDSADCRQTGLTELYKCRSETFVVLSYALQQMVEGYM